jgi:hypothetical protein
LKSEPGSGVDLNLVRLPNQVQELFLRGFLARVNA